MKQFLLCVIAILITSCADTSLTPSSSEAAVRVAPRRQRVVVEVQTPPAVAPAVESKPQPPAKKYKDGTVIIISHGPYSKLIHSFTDSWRSHCAIVLYDDNGQPWVYEATTPVIRKMTLEDYGPQVFDAWSERQKKQGVTMTWEFIQPKQDYTPEQLAAMKKYAEQKLGSPYLLRGYKRGWQTKNSMHCSHFVGSVLEAGGLMHCDGQAESPESLYQKVKQL